MLKESSLLKIPGMKKDKYGNIDFLGQRPQAGLRQHFEFLMTLEPNPLQEVKLPELLNWCRWGSRASVMWEATLPELLKLVDKWESVNSRIAHDLYGVKPSWERSYTPLITWQRLCENMSGLETHLRRGCPCGHLFHDSTPLWTHVTCPKCKEQVSNRVEVGPRGVGSYNLELKGGDGYAFAEACIESPSARRFLPQLRGLYAQPNVI